MSTKCRVRKIWSSELYSKKKVLASNSFAIPILIPRFGILEWTKEEILQIDVKTRKVLSVTGNFHRNSSVYEGYVTETLIPPQRRYRRYRDITNIKRMYVGI